MTINYALGDTGGTANFGTFTFDVVDSNGNVVSENFVYGQTAGATSSSNCSYGINAQAGRFEGVDSSKILVVEYQYSIANVVGPQGTEKQRWLNPPDQRLSAPRHNKYMNVLFYNGSTKTMSPLDIDPNDTNLHDTYWLPKSGVGP